MAYENFFIEGLDPTGLAAFGASEALQIIREARPEAKYGMVYFSAVAPDLVNNPELMRFLWCNPTTGVLKYWDGATWVQSSLAIGSLSGTLITPATLPLAALDITGANPLDILRINVAGNALVWESSSTLYAAGTFPIDRLTVASADNMFLRRVGGVTAWAYLTSVEVVNLIPTRGLRLSKIYVADATDKFVPSYDASLGYAKWVDVNSLVTFPTPAVAVPTIRVFDDPLPVAGTPYSTSWVATKTSARVRLWGGGGGGDYAPGGGNLAGGGGAGAYFEANITTVIGDTYTIIVGAKGSGGILGTTTHANVGTASYILHNGTVIAQANGGDPAGGQVQGLGGATLPGYTDAHQIRGGNGMAGTNAAPSGQGGQSPNGGCGGEYLDGTTLLSANTPGGGGGGGLNADGSDGAPGRVIIEY